MSVDYIDLNSRIMRRVFFIYTLRKLRDPFIGSFFVLGVALGVIASVVSTLDVLANALQLPTLIDSIAYVARAALTTEVSTQVVVAVALSAGLYLMCTFAIRGTKQAYRGFVWSTGTARKAVSSVLAGRIAIG